MGMEKEHIQDISRIDPTELSNDLDVRGQGKLWIHG